MINQIKACEADEPDALAFKVDASLNGTQYVFTIAISPEERSWDIIEGETDPDDELVQEVFSHPDVETALDEAAS
jgi:hypothetical protein